MKIDEILNEALDDRDPEEAKKQNAAKERARLQKAMSNRQATFIGSNATTWDSKANKRARDLEDRGISPIAIWQATGNWRGPEGEWRQEISDKDVTLKKTQGKGTLGDFINHPEFFKAYPGVDKSVKVRFVDNIEAEYGIPANGLFDPSINTLVIATKDVWTGEPRSDRDMLGTLAHEWQHSIQDNYEPDFAPGANPWIPAMDDITKTVNNQPIVKDPQSGEKFNPLNPFADEDGDYTNTKSYWDTGGEHMARAVDDRLEMDDLERLNNYPGNHMYNLNVHIPGNKVPKNAYGTNIPVDSYSEPRDGTTASATTTHKKGDSWHQKGNTTTTYRSKDGRYDWEKPNK